eukprot:546137_1
MANFSLVWWSGYAIIIGIFAFFYFNTEPPLTEEEIKASEDCSLPQEVMGMKADELNEHVWFCEALLSKKDTGKEIFVINFIQRRKSYTIENLYPKGFIPAKGCDISLETAEECYGKRSMPLLFKRFSFPFFIVSPTKIPFAVSKSLNITFENNFEWDFIVIVRYRSRRDFVNVREEFKEKMLLPYKEAIVGKTMIYISDADQIPIIVIILFSFWSAVIAVLYYILFCCISKVFH